MEVVLTKRGGGCFCITLNESSDHAIISVHMQKALFYYLSRWTM